MYILQKIHFFIVNICLAHFLAMGVQPKPNNYESKTDLRFIPTQEQGIAKVSLPVPQVHLHARKEDVFQNILSCIMDKCYIHII